ncbi:MAG TPA: tetratricopeptide repeat protein [Acidobacteriota bacterium]|nr:tetratricopeptide repeat protein [Acidobacteriota bacterium]
MPKQARPVVHHTPQGSPFVILAVGVVCLAVGLGIGYYFGRQAAQPGGSAAASAPDAAFIQNEASLRAAVQSNPGDLNALIQLGNLYYDHGRYRGAIEWYGKALDIDPKNADVRTDRGTSYWNLGQADPAIAEFQKALATDPSHAQTLYNLGVVYLNGKSNAAEAKKTWEHLLATNPNYPDRAKLQQEIAALSGQPPTMPAGAGQANATGSGVEDLLQKMQAKKQ